MMRSLAALRASQLRELTLHIRMISASAWSLGADPPSGPAAPSPAPPPAPLPPAPLPRPPTRLTHIVTTAIHRLVLLVTTIRRASANEVYVRRVLQEQVGVDPFDLDLLSLRRPEVFRLSVRHNIEPVTSLLRSRGLTGSALARVVAQAPGVLFTSVEDDLLPLCEFLKEELGVRGMGALVRHPHLAEAPAAALRRGAAALRAAGAAREETALMLWSYPDMFIGVGNAVAAAAERGGSASAVAAGEAPPEEGPGAEGGVALDAVVAALARVRTAKEAATAGGGAGGRAVESGRGGAAACGRGPGTPT